MFVLTSIPRRVTTDIVFPYFCVTSQLSMPDIFNFISGRYVCMNCKLTRHIVVRNMRPGIYIEFGGCGIQFIIQCTMMYLTYCLSCRLRGDPCRRYQHPFIQITVWWNFHDDVMKWKQFPRYWPFVRGIHRSPVDPPHKGQWRGAMVFSLIYVWTNIWAKTIGRPVIWDAIAIIMTSL